MFNSYEIFCDMTRLRWPCYTGDCLNKGDRMSRFNCIVLHCHHTTICKKETQNVMMLKLLSESCYSPNRCQQAKLWFFLNYVWGYRSVRDEP
jgi:hypothetical protein